MPLVVRYPSGVVIPVPLLCRFNLCLRGRVFVTTGTTLFPSSPPQFLPVDRGYLRDICIPVVCYLYVAVGLPVLLPFPFIGCLRYVGMPRYFLYILFWLVRIWWFYGYLYLTCCWVGQLYAVIPAYSLLFRG
jgi:hypothetical protein